MPSNLLTAQWRFAGMIKLLLMKAHELGFEVTFGDAYRDSGLYRKDGNDDFVPVGHERSLHGHRLALDINLFTRTGKYLKNTEDHRALGEYWISIGGAWGGANEGGDGNHYSLPIPELGMVF